MFHDDLQAGKNTHHFFKPYELVNIYDPVYISHIHHSEWQQYLLFAIMIMYNHEFCNLLRWYECIDTFSSCTFQAVWIGAHLLDVLLFGLRNHLKNLQIYVKIVWLVKI